MTVVASKQHGKAVAQAGSTWGQSMGIGRMTWPPEMPRARESPIMVLAQRSRASVSSSCCPRAASSWPRGSASAST